MNQTTITSQRGLSGFALKYSAIVCMILDHIHYHLHPVPFCPAAVPSQNISKTSEKNCRRKCGTNLTVWEINYR